ncbi:MAG: DUF4290 domain-containing protein [Bacteroidia bacterium]
MEYNTQLEKMIIPEYGRNIQRMINHCVTLTDREERNRCAKAIIQVMGQLNPHLRDVADFNHKLWDHLFIISKFQLDVDSPYPKPNAETFETKPDIVSYPKGRIKYKHYGKTIEEIIEKAKAYPEGAEKEELKRVIANHMKKSYINWNKDSVTDDTIIAQLDELSGGALKIAETTVLSVVTDQVKRNVSNSGGTGSTQKKHHHNNKHKHSGGGGKHNFKRNNNNNNGNNSNKY